MHFASPYDNIGMQCTNMEIRAETDSWGIGGLGHTYASAQRSAVLYREIPLNIWLFLKQIFRTLQKRLTLTIIKLFTNQSEPSVIPSGCLYTDASVNL